MDVPGFEARLRGLEARVAALEAPGPERAARTIDERVIGVDTSDLEVEGGLSINEFCAKFGFSRASFYNLRRLGRAPRLIKVGKRSIVSNAQARLFRERMEQEVAAREAAAQEVGDAQR